MRATRGFAVAVGAAAMLAAGTASASTSNVCKIAGITKAVAHKVFGAGAKAEYLTAYTPTLCEVIPKTYASNGSLEVYLYPKSAYTTNLSTIYPHGKDRLHRLHNLGPGAVYVVSPDHSVDDLLFKGGGYAVEIQNNEAAGQQSSVYPSEKRYLTLAHAIHSHLH
jgi:hypothetical protein